MSETCRVLFQNKFENLVHLVRFIIRVYHDAWSAECQMFIAVLSQALFYMNFCINADFILLSGKYTYILTLQRGVTSTARMLHALTHSSISRQVREQM